MKDDQEVTIEHEPLAPPYAVIRGQLEKGKIIPFLGAGASLGARPSNTAWMGDNPPPSYLPTGSELAKYLAKRTKFPPKEPLDLAKVAQYFDVAAGRDLLMEDLHEIFDVSFPFAPLHEYLADLALHKPQLIVTTNYDDLVERAFSKKSQPYDVVIHPRDPDLGNLILWRKSGSDKVIEVSPNSLDIDLNKVSVIYKFHGAVDRTQEGGKGDHYVISEDDYVDFIARMTRGQTIPAIFAEPFASRRFLFLGYSLSDWNLRVVWSRINKHLRSDVKTRSWAIQKDPNPLEQKLWDKRNVDIYNMSIDDFLRNMLEREPPESPEPPASDILAIAS